MALDLPAGTRSCARSLCSACLTALLRENFNTRQLSVQGWLSGTSPPHRSCREPVGQLCSQWPSPGHAYLDPNARGFDSDHCVQVWSHCSCGSHPVRSRLQLRQPWLPGRVRRPCQPQPCRLPASAHIFWRGSAGVYMDNLISSAHFQRHICMC